jgi:hypothetical protein
MSGQGDIWKIEILMTAKDVQTITEIETEAETIVAVVVSEIEIAEVVADSVETETVVAVVDSVAVETVADSAEETVVDSVAETVGGFGGGNRGGFGGGNRGQHRDGPSLGARVEILEKEIVNLKAIITKLTGEPIETQTLDKPKEDAE